MPFFSSPQGQNAFRFSCRLSPGTHLLTTKATQITPSATRATSAPADPVPEARLYDRNEMAMNPTSSEASNTSGFRWRMDFNARS